ncbi:hypothetical protein K501DRAFT_276619 [Backusella circina FSU 941]|nr:hypothetical protein K501DRAFT_276619 [Backusella circina FSU 941]
MTEGTVLHHMAFHIVQIWNYEGTNDYTLSGKVVLGFSNPPLINETTSIDKEGLRRKLRDLSLFHLGQGLFIITYSMVLDGNFLALSTDCIKGVGYSSKVVGSESTIIQEDNDVVENNQQILFLAQVATILPAVAAEKNNEVIRLDFHAIEVQVIVDV